MIYAPVIIPTLHRYEHIRKCIDSLSCNTNACYTELYISIDYPPSNKYLDGYLKTLKLLENYDFSKFKGVHIYKQESNLGPSGNSHFLVNKLKGNFDTYIYSEDDNEFSPNFLIYINEGLLRFKDDNDVMAICGCADTSWVSNKSNNVVKIKLCSGYGIGCWIRKKEPHYNEGVAFLMNKDNWTFKKFYSLYKHNKCLFSKYIAEIIARDYGLFWKDKTTMNFCDIPQSIYMHMTNRCVIAPILSKSRTFGNDGSGVNMAVSLDNGSIELDKSDDFRYQISDDLSFEDRNYVVGDRYLNKVLSVKKLYLSWMFVFILLLTFKNRRVLLNINKLIFGIKKI